MKKDAHETKRYRHKEHNDIMNVNEKSVSSFCFQTNSARLFIAQNIIWPMSVLIYYLCVIRHDTIRTNGKKKLYQYFFLSNHFEYIYCDEIPNLIVCDCKSIGLTLWTNKS